MPNWGSLAPTCFDIPAWSISTEWFAYLVFPAVAWIGRLASSAVRAVLGILTALLLFAYAMSSRKTTFRVTVLPAAFSNFRPAVLSLFFGRCRLQTDTC